MKHLSNKFYWIILLSTLAVYGLSLTYDFVLYDDQLNILNNRDLLQNRFLVFWAAPFQQLYVPIVYTIWTALHSLFGLNPAPYHAVGLMFHLANCILIFELLKRLKFAAPAALAGALFFMAHPIQVESVVWVTALKDKVFLFFSLLAILFYLFREPTTKNRIFALVFIALSILSKPTAIMTAPLIGLFVLYQELNRGRRLAEVAKEHWLLTLPFVAAVLVIYLTDKAQMHGEDGDIRVFGIDKLVIMADAFGFYLSKILVPIGISSDYVRSPHKVLQLKLYWGNLLLTLTTVAGLAVFWLKKMRHSTNEAKSVMIFAVLCWGLYFLPTSGITPFSYQRTSTVADRYAYPLMISAAVAFAAIYSTILRLEKSQFYSRLYYLGIGVLGFSTIVQASNWRNHDAFSFSAIEANPTGYFANLGVGNYYLEKREYYSAFRHFATARKSNPIELAPLVSILLLYFDSKQYAQLDRFAAENLTDEKLSKLHAEPEDLYALYNILIDLNFERKNYDLTLENLCKLVKRANFTATEKAEIDEKFRKLSVATGKSTISCR